MVRKTRIAAAAEGGAQVHAVGSNRKLLHYFWDGVYAAGIASPGEVLFVGCCACARHNMINVVMGRTALPQKSTPQRAPECIGIALCCNDLSAESQTSQSFWAMLTATSTLLCAWYEA